MADATSPVISVQGSTLVMSGALDARSSTRVREALYAHLSDHQHVVVDLDGVESVDLTTLRVLAAASRGADREGRHLTLRGCGPAVRRMLHLTHLIRVVDVDRTPSLTASA
ncbi:STAS domain-containing protein [Nocardioides acrostichi]|uniref:STAS domain-containing protein n=1 Tax=Nocardioides acrostichi TaxID=2784339 RepID=A0A930UXQ7_9ACTN|nr:STAS domain-containing protein [Nocardioides acrostichi]MBF4162808.1 STAS domain-containing protein [Nocardioides acrostichi]